MVLNKRNLADGRTIIARQYTIIVQTDDMLSDILEDWTDFKKDERVNAVYDKVEEFVNRSDDLKKDIIRRYADDLKTMRYSTRREVLQLV